MSDGFSPTAEAMNCPPACAETVFSCSIAAGDTSHETSATFSSRARSRASLPHVVVLPEPCKPAISTIAGGCVARSSDVRLAHQFGELAMHDADERLARRQAADDFGAEAALFTDR